MAAPLTIPETLKRSEEEKRIELFDQQIEPDPDCSRCSDAGGDYLCSSCLQDDEDSRAEMDVDRMREEYS